MLNKHKNVRLYVKGVFNANQLGENKKFSDDFNYLEFAPVYQNARYINSIFETAS